MSDKCSFFETISKRIPSREQGIGISNVHTSVKHWCSNDKCQIPFEVAKNCVINQLHCEGQTLVEGKCLLNSDEYLRGAGIR